VRRACACVRYVHNRVHLRYSTQQASRNHNATTPSNGEEPGRHAATDQVSGEGTTRGHRSVGNQCGGVVAGVRAGSGERPAGYPGVVRRCVGVVCVRWCSPAADQPPSRMSSTCTSREETGEGHSEAGRKGGGVCVCGAVKGGGRGVWVWGVQQRAGVEVACVQ